LSWHSEATPDFKAKTLSGDRVRLATYGGQAVAFLFVSPHCGSCRRKVALFVRLGALAKERAGVLFVLVSDSSTSETYNWITTIREEDGVEVNLPILVAPRTISDFFMTYNPRGLTPYYCLINEQGAVQARDPVDLGEWPRLQREWEGASAVRSFSPLHSRYR
jgi:alkyl hydroperoxide reductase subunit AhpC